MKSLPVLAATVVAIAVLPAASGAATGPTYWSQSGCGSCHTLAAAGSTGTNGPNLDQLRPSAATVAGKVVTGGDGMPSFGSSMPAAEIQSLAAWVASVAGTSATTSVTTVPAPVTRRLQASLKRLGFFHGPVTGFYGPVTIAAVKRFQHSAGLTADGLWGPKTAASLKKRLH